MKYKLMVGVIAGFAVVSAFAVAPMVAKADDQAEKRYGWSESGQGMGHGRSGALESKAEALGVSVDELKAALESKTMYEVAQEKGFTLEDFQAKMRSASQKRWQDRGLSDEVIAERTAAQAERQADCDGDGEHRGRGRLTE